MEIYILSELRVIRDFEDFDDYLSFAKPLFDGIDDELLQEMKDQFKLYKKEYINIEALTSSTYMTAKQEELIAKYENISAKEKIKEIMDELSVNIDEENLTLIYNDLKDNKTTLDEIIYVAINRILESDIALNNIKTLRDETRKAMKGTEFEQFLTE